MINLVSARFILLMLIIFGALLRETCQKPFKVTSEDCRRECDAISADHAKAKASTLIKTSRRLTETLLRIPHSNLDI